MAVLENKSIRLHLVVCRIGDWHGGIDGQQGSGAEQMRQIDIDSLDEATLIELNARIVERLQYLHHQRTTAALQDIRVAVKGPLASGFVSADLHHLWTHNWA